MVVSVVTALQGSLTSAFRKSCRLFRFESATKDNGAERFDFSSKRSEANKL